MKTQYRLIICSLYILIFTAIIYSQSLDEANNLFQQGATLFQQGSYDESIPYFIEAEEIYERQKKLEYDNSAYTSLWRGIARYYLYDYENAIIDFQSAIGKSKIKNDVDVLLSSSLHLANAYFAIDNWRDAYKIYLTTLTVIDKNKKVEYYPSVYESLGNIDFAWGKYDSAESYYLKALEHANNLGYRDNIINTKIALGRVYHARYDLDRAIETYDKLLENEGIVDSQYYPTILNSLGIAYFEKGESQIALNYYNQALPIVDKLNNFIEKIRLFIHIGGALHNLEKYEEAIQYYEKALPLAFEYGRIDDASRCLLNLGLSHIYLEDYESAVDYLKRSIDIKEELRLSVVGASRRDYLAAEMKTYYILSTVYLHMDRPDDAADVMEQSSSKYLRDQLLNNENALPFDGVKEFQKTLDSKKSILKVGSVNTLWQSVINISDSEVSGNYSFQYELLEKLPMSFLTDFERLEDNHRGLNSIKPPEDLIPLGEMSVTDLIQYYRILLSSRGNVREIRKIGRLLYDHLLGPVEEDFTDKEQLLIVPDGVLAFIPFETLVMPDGRYLIEKYDISYAQSLAVMEIVNKRNYRDERSEFLGIGGSNYTSDDQIKMNPLYKELIVDQWNDLPGTLEELNNIDLIFEDSVIFTADNASETMIKTLSNSSDLEKYKIIHFATHGFVSPEFPDLSALVLSQNLNDGNDGYLNVSEITQLEIEADFVNLSACETGLGKIYGGEGVVGLAQAFLLAGANSLSVSLWQVADDSTKNFMTGFYQLVHDEEKTFKQAMAIMKNKFLNSENYSHPYYWAPFVFYGE